MLINIRSENSRGCVDTYGGELVSYINGETEYVWQGIPEHWNGRAPILFPVCCRAKDDLIAFGGKEYPMPKHGIARKRQFEPVVISKDRVVVEQRATEETLEMFPFFYVLDADYRISDKGFSAKFTVRNLDRNEMVFCLGGHPGFNVPLRPEDGGFEDHVIVFDNAKKCTVSLTKDSYMDPSVPKLNKLKRTNRLPLKYSDFDNDALIIEGLPEKALTLTSKKSGRGFRFMFDELRSNGVNICLGTDGCASSNNLDMLETIKTSLLFQKAWRGDKDTVTLKDALNAVTVNAAKFFGLNTGRIEEGAIADISIVDLGSSFFLSNAPVLSNLVWSAHSDSIDSVIASGRFVMRHRKVEGEEEILSLARRQLDKIRV